MQINAIKIDGVTPKPPILKIWVTFSDKQNQIQFRVDFEITVSTLKLKKCI